MAEARKIAAEMLLDGVDGEYIYRRASKSSNGNHVMHLNLKMNHVGLLGRMEGGWFNFAMLGELFLPNRKS